MVYDHTIVYKASRDDQIVDSLSRMHEGHLLAFSMSRYDLVSQLKHEYTTSTDL